MFLFPTVEFLLQFTVRLNSFGNWTSPSDNSNDCWKSLCLVNWDAAPCVWTLKALTRNLLTYLLTCCQSAITGCRYWHDSLSMNHARPNVTTYNKYNTLHHIHDFTAVILHDINLQAVWYRPIVAVFESAFSWSSSDFSDIIIRSAGWIDVEGFLLQRGRCFFSANFSDNARIWFNPVSDKQTPSKKNVFGTFGGMSAPIHHKTTYMWYLIQNKTTYTQ